MIARQRPLGAGFFLDDFFGLFLRGGGLGGGGFRCLPVLFGSGTMV